MKTVTTRIRNSLLALVFGLMLAGPLVLVQDANAGRSKSNGSVRHSSKSSKSSKSKKSKGIGGKQDRSKGRSPGYSQGRRHNNRRGRNWGDARRDHRRRRAIRHLFRVGVRLLMPPPNYTVVVVSGRSYFYAGGLYYVHSGPHYVIVRPPRGAVVYSVPTTITVVYVGETPYYYDGGTYYIATDAVAYRPGETPANVPPPAEVTVNINMEGEVSEQPPEAVEMVEAGDHNFGVVEAPIGATVPYLPDEAEEQIVGESKYFLASGVWYKPFAGEGDVIYMVVADPN